jgi:hypothetical protein
MRNLMITASALALALSLGAGAAAAREVSGKIEAISPALPYITLSNGTSFNLVGEAQAAWCQGTNAANLLYDNAFSTCASDHNSGGPNLRVGERVTVVTGAGGEADRILVR